MALNKLKRGTSLFQQLVIWIGVILSVFLLLFGISNSASAIENETKVQTILCSSSDTPVLTDFQPESDSTVNTNSINLTADTETTTQVDIFVNGAYSHSVSLTPGEQLDTDVSLSVGTNTVRIDAHFSCSSLSETYNLVITYEPDVVDPGPGSGTDTDVDKDGQPPNQVSSGGFIGFVGAISSESLLDRVKQKLGVGDVRYDSDDFPVLFYEPGVGSIAFNWFILAISIAALVFTFLPAGLYLVTFTFLEPKNRSVIFAMRIIFLLIAVSLILLLLFF